MASLSKIIDVQSHAILNIGQQVPLANQARWSVEGQRSGGDFRRINEALAEIVAKHLKRFGAIATFPGKTIDGSLSKMEYVLDTLKYALLDFGPSPRNPVSLVHRNTRVKSCARNS